MARIVSDAFTLFNFLSQQMSCRKFGHGRVSPEGIIGRVSPDGTVGRASPEDAKEGRHWAFGSSTPRDLAHMTAISTAQRVYDAKSPKKSITSPEFATPVHKRSTTAPQPIQRPTAPTPSKRVDDDAASEPDFVQKHEKAKTPEASKAKMEEADFTHAHELAAEVCSTERVPHNLHEEESATAHQSTVTGLKDQIVVSELTEAAPGKEIVIDKNEAGGNLAEFVEMKTNEILQKGEKVSDDLAKDLKDFAMGMKAAAETKVEEQQAAVQKTLEGVDEVLVKTKEVIGDVGDSMVDKIGSVVTGAITSVVSDPSDHHHNNSSTVETPATKA
ncbi:unnamed protein product [Nippostrongylus brasiliensis]|uniref:Late embryogenesis abundant protein n=1 Tax=Nippostrongylus brasiliensis TaxID=27835 RepID=A0A0N4YD12_NIPBR|nr:unnamed protein product [Nippostrongylus brasiliensis]